MSTGRAPLQIVTWIALVAIAIGVSWALSGPIRRGATVTGGQTATPIMVGSDAVEEHFNATVWPTVLPLEVPLQSRGSWSPQEGSIDPEYKAGRLNGGYHARVRVVRLYPVRYNSPDGREPTREDYPNLLEYAEFQERMYSMQLEVVEAFRSETDAQGFLAATLESYLQGANPLDGRVRIGQEAVVIGTVLKQDEYSLGPGFEWLMQEADAVGSDSGTGHGSYVPIGMFAMYVIDGDVARELGTLTPYPLARVLASVQSANQ